MYKIVVHPTADNRGVCSNIANILGVGHVPHRRKNKAVLLVAEFDLKKTVTLLQRYVDKGILVSYKVKKQKAVVA